MDFKPSDLRPAGVKVALSVLAVLAVIGIFVATDEVEALPPVSFHHVCYHNLMPYMLVTVPFENSIPDCPENEASWNPVWDGQDGYDCGNGKEGTFPCVRERHIDCEFTSEPGGL